MNASRRILAAAATASLWSAAALAQTPGVTYNSPGSGGSFTTSPAPIATTPAPIAAAPVGTISSAAAAAAPGGGGELSLRANHGDWEVLCDASNACLMTQIHRNDEGSPDVIFKVSKPRVASSTGQTIPALAEIFVPLGVFLPEGLALRIDQQEPVVAPFYSCVPLGCSVRAPLTDQIVETLKRGTTVTVIVAVNPRNTIEIPLSLRGFTAAMGAI